MSCAVAALTSWTGIGVTSTSVIVPYIIDWVAVDLSQIQGFSFLVKIASRQIHLRLHLVHRCDGVFQDHALTENWLPGSSCNIIIIIVLIIIIIFRLGVNKPKSSTLCSGESTNQMERYFFWWGENRSTGENLLKHSREPLNSNH